MSCINKHFLGIVNLYGRYIPNCADKSLPLTQILKSHKKTNPPITFSSDTLSSFELIKKDFASVPSLAHPVSGVSLSLIVVASDSAVGVIFQLTINGLIQPLTFFS